MHHLTTYTAISAAITLFFLLLGGFWLLRGIWQKQKAEVLKRLGLAADHPIEPAIRIRSNVKNPSLRSGVEHSLSGRIQAMLDQSGLKLHVGPFLGLTLFIIGSVFILTFLSTQSLLSSLVSVSIIVPGIYVFLNHRLAKQQRQLADSLPMALELMTFSLRAGNTIEEAIRSAAEDIHAPLKQEFQRCYDEYAMGRPIEASLDQLRRRWPAVLALHNFVEAVTILKRTGGNIITVIESIITSIEAQATYEQKYRSLTAEGRLSGKILMFLPLIGIIFHAFTGFDQLTDMVGDPIGRTILILGCALWGAGAIWVFHLAHPRQ